MIRLFLRRCGLSLFCVLSVALLVTSCQVIKPEPAKPEFSFLRASGTRTVDEAGNEIVLKGCNLGNWFLLEMWMLDISGIPDQYTFEKILADRFGEERKNELMEVYRENWITRRDFEIVRTFDFNVVRIPFHYSLVEDSGFRWLDRAIEMARDHGLYVILDMHGVPGGQSTDHTTGRKDQNRIYTDRECQDRFLKLWKGIATHYKDSPVVAAYEPVNEPFGDYRTANHHDALADLMDRVYDEIRAVDERHMIIIPGTRDGFWFYGRPQDRGWKNVMFTEHYYPGVHGSGPSLAAHRHHINRLLPGTRHYLEYVDAPFLVGEFNVVFRRGGGPVLMRQYYDMFAEDGWWATMWSYKLIKGSAGLGRDNWYMVKNLHRPPSISIRRSTDEEIEAYFRWFGEMEYAVYEDLRTALTTPEPERLALEDPPHPMEPPYVDEMQDWTGTDIACRPEGGQRVYSEDRMDVYGGGRDIWNDHDEFRFVSQEVDGNFGFEAKVDAFTDVNPYGKAGIMIRGGLEPDSPHVLLHTFPNNQVVLGWREVEGGDMKEKKLPIYELPIRFRMERYNGQLTVLYALSDEKWREIESFDFEWLSSPCQVGFAVLSHDDRYLAKASFSDIEMNKE